jgi:hypothetical protein
VKSQLQILSYSVLAVLFVAIFGWYANDLINATEIPKSERKWSDSRLDQEYFEFFSLTWQVKPLNEFAEADHFRFWNLPSNRNVSLVDVQFNSETSGSVTVKLKGPDDFLNSPDKPRYTYEGHISAAELTELRHLLDESFFWAVPPGELAWSCIMEDDGTSYVVETNLGGQYRLWANACDASPEMLNLAEFFDTVANRIAWPVFAESSR